MRSYIAALALPLLTLAGHAAASPLEQRQVPSSRASSATTTASAALLETTISGKLTTVTVAVPTDTSRSATVSSSVASSIISTFAATIGNSTASTATPTTQASNATATDKPICSNPKFGPFCLPATNTTVYVGQNYWVTWDLTLFNLNTTVTVALNYANNSNVAAWISDGMPREQGFLVLTMDSSWLQGAGSRDLSFVMITYSPVSNHVAMPLDGPSVTLTTPGIAPPPPTKMPDLHSMAIGLPVALGSMILIITILFIGMKKHRQIDVLAILKKKTRRNGGSGYGVGKSRRQRMGMQKKKGAIRLEEREIHDEAYKYRDEPVLTNDKIDDNNDNHREEEEDAIVSVASSPALAPAPRLDIVKDEAEGWTLEKPRFPGPGHGHAREESLGSLVGDGDDEGREERNAFRREMKAQEVRRLAGPIIPSGGTGPRS